MVDNLTPEKRSKVMASIRGKNTKPEIKIRKILWSKGIRYRIHDKKVIGTPDILIRKNKIAVFIDGCFWHGCRRCYKEPTTNTHFWREKIQNNKKRRRKVKKLLHNKGWKVLEYWEHQVNTEPYRVVEEITRYL